jgi:hypothetical protein
MMPVRLRRTTVVVAVLVAAWLLPALADAAPRHRATLARQCEGTPHRCLIATWHERLTAPRHARNPGSNDALDDLDDWDLGADPAPRTFVDGHPAISDPDDTPSWLRVTRAPDPRAARLIVWRKLDAPRPPPAI